MDEVMNILQVYTQILGLQGHTGKHHSTSAFSTGLFSASAPSLTPGLSYRKATGLFWLLKQEKDWVFFR